MKWSVTELLSSTYRARKDGGPTAYIYRSLRWPDFYEHGGADAYEVRCGGAAIALIRLEGKGASVCSLPAAAACASIGELDLVELALWLNKLRRPAPLN